MWKWFSRRPPRNLSEDGIRQRLQAAQCLVLEQKERRTRSSLPIKEENRRNRFRELLPHDEPDAALHYRPPSLTIGSRHAAALEAILQGHRASAELFTELYGGGFVSKDPRGRWRITAMGKELIEKHKLLTPEGCLVAGVRCATGWNNDQSS